MKLIACCDIKGGFAKDKQIPWLKEDFSKLDLKRFKELTNGQCVVMGRNTYNEIASLRTIKDSVLPNRECYVITSDPDNACEGATTILTLDDIQTDKEIFIIGGGKLYSNTIKHCDTVYLTVINRDYECDQFFPGQCLVNYKADHVQSEHPDMVFVTYTKI
jgi:dihydrofolate reductase